MDTLNLTVPSVKPCVFCFSVFLFFWRNVHNFPKKSKKINVWTKNWKIFIFYIFWKYQFLVIFHFCWYFCEFLCFLLFCCFLIFLWILVFFCVLLVFWNFWQVTKVVLFFFCDRKMIGRNPYSCSIVKSRFNYIREIPNDVR